MDSGSLITQSLSRYFLAPLNNPVINDGVTLSYIGASIHNRPQNLPQPLDFVGGTPLHVGVIGILRAASIPTIRAIAKFADNINHAEQSP